MEKPEYGQKTMVKENGIEYSSREERVKEKIVYKVVPVPYYYPVPVDAEWYYKHHEPPMRNGNERFIGYDDPIFDHFPFPPPTPHGFPPPPRSRDSHYYTANGREEIERYGRPVSPLYRKSPSRGDYSPASPANRKHTKENGEHQRQKTPSGSDKENQSEITENNVDKENEGANSKKDDSLENPSENSEENEGKGEEISDGNSSKDEEKDINGDEQSRKRKRLMMTFPYDQRKKNSVKDENSTVDENENDNNTESNEQHSPTNQVDHKRIRNEEFEGRERGYMKQSPYSNGAPNGHYPYMVMRSPPYMESDMIRSPRYGERHAIYESRRYDESYKEGHKSDGGPDEKKEIRYHPNGRRARTVFTRQQLLTLNNVFEKHPFVSGERMSELSDQLGLDRKIVKIWFQNKRQYARKKGSLVERNEEYYYDFPERYSQSSAPPTMAERWKNGN